MHHVNQPSVVCVWFRSSVAAFCVRTFDTACCCWLMTYCTFKDLVFGCSKGSRWQGVGLRPRAHYGDLVSQSCHRPGQSHDRSHGGHADRVQGAVRLQAAHALTLCRFFSPEGLCLTIDVGQVCGWGGVGQGAVEWGGVFSCCLLPFRCSAADQL